MSKSWFLASLCVLGLAVIYTEVRLSLGSREPSLSSAPADRVAALEDRMDRRFDEISARLDRMEANPAPAPASAPVAAPADATTAASAPTDAASAASPTDGEKPATDAEKAVRAVLDKIAKGTATSDDVDSLWNLLQGPAAGMADEAIKAFAAAVKAHPNDPEAHYGLGVALTSKFLSGNVSQMEVATLSAQADQQFTKTLELDDHHFGARFSKAYSYTFWPPNLGKGPEAIRNFEVLVDQYGGDPSRKQMETVYYNLGKEYSKLGNKEKARKWYREGLSVFPDSKEMKAELDAMGE